MWKQKRRSGFNNKKTWLDGFLFDSKDEAKYWTILKLREASGEISNLERQKRFDLIVCLKFVAYMKIDFTYLENGKQIAYDWKGRKGQDTAWNLKRKIFTAIYGKEWELITNLDKPKKTKTSKKKLS